MKGVNRNLGFLGSLGFGAAAMYIFDPLAGRRRRALARDKISRFAHEATDAIEVGSRDLKNRALGLAAQTKKLIVKESISDKLLADRIRSDLGFLVSHPGSIEIKAKDGTVALSGPIFKSEVDRL